MQLYQYASALNGEIIKIFMLNLKIKWGDFF